MRPRESRTRGPSVAVVPGKTLVILSPAPRPPGPACRPPRHGPPGPRRPSPSPPSHTKGAPVPLPRCPPAHLRHAARAACQTVGSVWGYGHRPRAGMTRPRLKHCRQSGGHCSPRPPRRPSSGPPAPHWVNAGCTVGARPPSTRGPSLLGRLRGAATALPRLPVDVTAGPWPPPPLLSRARGPVRIHFRGPRRPSHVAWGDAEQSVGA